MSPFELAEPRTLKEALALLDASGVRPMSGGTALMLMMKAGVLRPTRLVSLRHLAGLHGIDVGLKGELRVGAMTTLRALEKSPLVSKGWPVIARTLRTLSNVRVRNVATIGGHLSHGDPHMDLPPLLSALDASVTIVGPKGERSCLVESLYAGYLETTLTQGEIITAVTVPAMGSRRVAYMKCTTRSADDWPALGVAVVLEMNGDTVRVARIVVSAATDTPTRLAKAESALRESRADDATLASAGEAGAAEAGVIGDAHGSAAYKRELLRVYLARAVRAALADR